MDIAQLKTFVELSRTRHFGKAAKSLFITQSTVSVRIRMLEEDLGVRLLTRDRNNIQLTVAGTRFLPLAEQMLNTWNLAKQTTGLDSESKTLLSIGAVFSLWDAGLRKGIYDFYQTQETIAINLVAQAQEQLYRSIVEGSVDLCIMYEQPKVSGLEALSIGSLELILVSTHKNINSKDLMERPDYVLVNWGTAFSLLHAKNFPNIPVPSIRVDFARLALEYLLEYGGSTYLAQSMIIPELTENILHPVEDAPVINREFFLVYKTSTSKIDIINNIADFLGRNKLPSPDG
ncbi:MAG: LysR family transcriptional regulator [Gammaproteobacteria bacterium]|nr:LysR family transcriptional regulator [Gammaproteobacteria bacterium]